MDFTYSDSILLGLVQGLTEFLPISSSGHLVLAKQVLSVSDVPITYDIFFHFATLLAVLTWFFKDIVILVIAFFHGLNSILRGPGWKQIYSTDTGVRLIAAILIGTIPAVFVGLLLKDTIEDLFTDPSAVSVFLLITGFILLSTRWTKKGTGDVSIRKALIIGCGQALALFPGISRSGTTITAGLWSGIRPEKAAKFSFLLAIPAIFGAAVLEFSSVSAEMLKSEAFLLLSGGFAAYISGLIAISVVMRIVEQGKFFWFGIYCIFIAVVSLSLI